MAVLELDYMEYANDGAAQATYVSSKPVKSTIKTNFETGGVGTGPIYGDGAGGNERMAIGFQSNTTIAVSKVELHLSKSGSPTDNIHARIETDDSGKPSDTIVTNGESQAVDVSGLPGAGSEDWITFTFTTPPTVTLNTLYWLVLRRTGSRDTDNRINWTNDTTDPDYPYAAANRSNGTWAAQDFRAMYFRVYFATVVLQCYSEDTIKQQGSYSLKAVAAQTDSLNETLTKSGLSINLSDRTTLKLYVRANRAGTNIQARLYDSVGGWITKDVNVTSTGEFIEIDVDISGVSNANKSNITKIEFKILNADSDTTYYIDNFYAPEVIVGNAVLFGAAF